MATEEQGAVELSEQERVELKQLAELILETAVSDGLFADLVELSAPILEVAREENTAEDGTWPPSSGWSSFPTYSAADTVLRELLLDSGDLDSLDDAVEQKLTAAARAYGAKGDSATKENSPPATEDEFDEIEEILQDRLGDSAPSRDELKDILGSSVPEFLSEARDFGWLDPAAVEATVEHFAVSGLFQSDAQQSLIAAIREAATSYSEGNTPSVLIEIPDGKEIPEELRANLGVRINTGATAVENELIPSWEPPAEFDIEMTEADLSPENSEADTSDEGEWGLAEIDGEDEPDDDGFFGLEHNHQHHENHDHVHQILDDELRGANDYEGEPTDEREIATLALISEGILFAELSEVLLQDLIAEAEPLIRRARAKGSEWWMTREATSEVAELLSTVLIGEGWPVLGSQDDETVLAAGRSHRELLQRYAVTYPLDPEPTRDERLQSARGRERYEILLEERGERSVDPLGERELRVVADILEEGFAEAPTRTLIEDVGSLVSDATLEAGRSRGNIQLSVGLSGEVLRLGYELIGGDATAIAGAEAVQAAVRTYRTEDLTEDEFIAHYDQSRWPSVGATVDLSIFTVIDGKLQVLLIERGNHPEKGKWALPGGFVNTDESLDQAALRELQEETAVDLSEGGYLEQVKTYGYPGRDRRGFIISTLYAALIAELPEPEAGDDASGARFFPVDEVLADGFPLAFDHAMLLGDALERVRAKLEYSPIVFDFLPEGGFTIDELRKVYETVWGFEILPSDFRRKISQAQGALAASEEPSAGKALWTRGEATTFFPPLDRRQVLRDPQSESL